MSLSQPVLSVTRFDISVARYIAPSQDTAQKQGFPQNCRKLILLRWCTASKKRAFAFLIAIVTTSTTLHYLLLVVHGEVKKKSHILPWKTRFDCKPKKNLTESGETDAVLLSPRSSKGTTMEFMDLRVWYTTPNMDQYGSMCCFPSQPHMIKSEHLWLNWLINSTSD